MFVKKDEKFQSVFYIPSECRHLWLSIISCLSLLPSFCGTCFSIILYKFVNRANCFSVFLAFKLSFVNKILQATFPHASSKFQLFPSNHYEHFFHSLYYFFLICHVFKQSLKKKKNLNIVPGGQVVQEIGEQGKSNVLVPFFFLFNLTSLVPLYGERSKRLNLLSQSEIVMKISRYYANVKHCKGFQR